MKRILSVLLVTFILINGFSASVYGITINGLAKEEETSTKIKSTTTEVDKSFQLERYEFVYENSLIKEIYINGKLSVKNSFDGNVRIVKDGTDYCEFTYNSENDITSEVRNGKLITYLYKEQENSMYLTLNGFNYEGNNYYYTKDNMGRIDGITNAEGKLTAKYEYDTNGFKVVNVLGKVGNEWVSNNDVEFIGNVNRIRHQSSYFDIETELYYQNAVFYNSIDGALVVENSGSRNIEIEPLSYGEELDYEIYCMQQECLSDPEFNDSVPQNSDWASGCSNIEVVARVIYGENTHVAIDQRAVAYVIRNRAVRRNLSPRATVLEAGQFSAAAPSDQAVKCHSSGEVGWANAVYLACLLCYTLDEYDWEELDVIPSGMGNQEYFRSKARRSGFTQSGNTLYYNAAAICEVYGAGYGSIESCTELDNFWNNRSDQNVYFSYLGGN